MRGDVLSEYELLRSALHGFTSTYRNSNKVTQNLVLRDVDHYLTGRIQEWRKETSDGRRECRDECTRSRSRSERLLPSQWPV